MVSVPIMGGVIIKAVLCAIEEERARFSPRSGE